MKYSADFETTTNPEDCRVWGWGLCDIENPNEFIAGTTIDSFFDLMLDKAVNNSITAYFHNLKFDGEFVLYYLFRTGWRHIASKEKFSENTFKTLISDTGLFYQIKMCVWQNGKHTNTLTLLDSLKILPFSVSKIAKAFGLKESKETIDYDEYRAPNHKLTPTEVSYIRNDVVIVARALKILFDQNLNKMTQGANALFDYKNTITERKFERIFPTPKYDADIRQAYKGGFTYLKPEYAGVELENLIGLDVNSLYPFVMHDKPLPFGDGVFFEGEYTKDALYPLYVQSISCQFRLKEGFIPTIQIKGSRFVDTEYLTDSGDSSVTLCLTSLDIELLFKHYDVYDIEYHSGWKFRASCEHFKPYIDKWYAIKSEAKETNNSGLYTLAKLMQNALYGKLASAPHGKSKIPYFQDGLVKYRVSPLEDHKAVYIPAGAFITSWARYITICAAQANYNRFVYSDTDSLYLLGNELPTNLFIDSEKLGAWDFEKVIKRAKFLRQKSYILEARSPKDSDYSTIITCAGMPKQCHSNVTWDNFSIGQQIPGKLAAKRVKGGVVLMDTFFTFKS